LTDERLGEEERDHVVQGGDAATGAGEEGNADVIEP
jgi:hypothetical protein